MSTPLVSVIMVTYGHENYIKYAIEGVLMQQCDFEIELIIANDCSPDETEKVIKSIIENHPKGHWIKYTKHEINKGAEENFVWATKQCTGKNIALCEGDDYWIDPYKLQKQLDFLESNEDCGLVCTDFNILHQATGKIEESLFKNEPNRFPVYKNFEDFLYAAGYMAPCTWLLRREFLPTYTKNYVDGTFAWLLEVYAQSKVGFVKDTTTVYRVLDESASHSKSLQKRFQRSKGVLKIQLDFIGQYALNIEFKLKILRKYYKMVLPTLVALNEKEEIAKAMLYLPKVNRTLKDNLLFFIAKMYFGSKLMKIIYYYK